MEHLLARGLQINTIIFRQEERLRIQELAVNIFQSRRALLILIPRNKNISSFQFLTIFY